MRNQYLFILSTLLITLSGHLANAQIFTGGNVSATYDNGIYIDVAPVIGYRVSELSAGISPVFSYKKPESSNQTFYSAGARIFSQYHFIENAFLHGEFQAMNNSISETLPDGSRRHFREWIFSLPVGAGYEYKLSDKARVQASVLYDLIQDKNSPNRKPIIRGGIVYDL